MSSTVLDTMDKMVPAFKEFIDMVPAFKEFIEV